MLDIRFIRDNAEAVQAAAEHKGCDVSIATLLQLDDERREVRRQVDELRQQRNEIAAQMKGGKPDPSLIEQGKAIKAKLSGLEARLGEIEERYTALLKQVPNMPHADVPVGLSEDENVEVKVVGDIPKFDFAPKNHYEIAEAKGWLDKERAAKVAGARFAISWVIWCCCNRRLYSL